MLRQATKNPGFVHPAGSGGQALASSTKRTLVLAPARGVGSGAMPRRATRRYESTSAPSSDPLGVGETSAQSARAVASVVNDSRERGPRMYQDTSSTDA